MALLQVWRIRAHLTLHFITFNMGLKRKKKRLSIINVMTYTYIIFLTKLEITGAEKVKNGSEIWVKILICKPQCIHRYIFSQSLLQSSHSTVLWNFQHKTSSVAMHLNLSTSHPCPICLIQKAITPSSNTKKFLYDYSVSKLGHFFIYST